MVDQRTELGLGGRTDRRKNVDRRVSIEASTGDKRSGEDRRKGDRRGHYHNLFNPDDDFLYEVFVWLIDNTEGEWSSGANEHEPEDSPVTCRVRFEEEKDLQAFITWLDEWRDQHAEA